MLFVKTLFTLLLSFLFVFQPLLPISCVEAFNGKDIDLDVRNPQLQYKKFMKPYMISARKRIEQQWDSFDPCVGRTVKFNFIIQPDGNVYDMKPIDGDDTNLLGLACSSVNNALPFNALPNYIQPIEIAATFRSKKRRINGDKSAAAKAIIQTTLAAGFLALAGFAVYQLCKTSNSRYQSDYNQYRGPGCIGLSDCRICDHCLYCEYCKTAAVPCGKYYLGH